MHSVAVALALSSLLAGSHDRLDRAARGQPVQAEAAKARILNAVSSAPAVAPPKSWLVATGNRISFAPGLHEALRTSEPSRATLVVPIAGIGEIRLSLRRFHAVASDARVELGTSRRTPSAVLTAALRGVVHFDGSVDGYPGSSCYLAFGATGVAGWIDLGDGRGHFTLQGAGDTADRIGLISGDSAFVRTNGTSAPDVPTCGGALGHDHGGEGGVAGTGDIPPGVRKVVELAVDSDYDFYAIFGDATAASEYVAALNGAVSAIYRRDCDATIVTKYLRLQPDAADLFNDPDPLGPFRSYWEPIAEPSRDLFTLFTGRRNLPYGGVAWLNAACGDYGYSVNGYLIGSFADAVETNPGNWDINVVAHELGHNLGTRHTHDYAIDACASGAVQRGTIMSYCHVVQGAGGNIDLRFHRGTVEPIETFMAQAACLASDCDDDGAMDADEIAADPALDSNGDGILDACQDCNGNGMPDPVEIALELIGDSDGDGLPDPCETDCDGDGVADSLEIALDGALDSDGNMRLDACQPDCNASGVADAVEINADMTLDRSRDGRVDSCEDCDGDGVADFTELRGSRSRWVASSADTLLRELDPRSGVVRRTVACGTTSANDLAIGSDGRLYAAVGSRVWALDRVADTAATQWSVALANTVRGLAVAPDGRLAALLSNGRIDVLAADGTVATTFVATGLATNARDIVFRRAPDGSTEAIVSHDAGVIARYPWPSGAASVLATAPTGERVLRGLYAFADGSFLVMSNEARGIFRYTGEGVRVGLWSVESGSLLNGVHSLCDAGDGQTILATAGSSSSTVNGYNRTRGYLERTFRVYPSDAPSATAIVVAPPSATDANGNLVPDECEDPVGDLNGDGLVNGADLAELLAAWGACAGCAADLDGDGSVGAADLSILLAAWR
ncbi:MAG: hypothetical protein RLY21_1275 [Planctomycetota bacterium]|jgi:hypothetical protein